jgi:hypothetical protein
MFYKNPSCAFVSSPLPQPFPPKGEGSVSILNFKKFKSFNKPKTENNSNIFNPFNLLNFSLKRENVYKWNFLPASPLGD